MTIRKLAIIGNGLSKRIGIPLMGECRAVTQDLLRKGRFGAHTGWNFGDGPECETNTVKKVLAQWASSDPDVEKFGEQLVRAATTDAGRRAKPVLTE